MRIFLFLLVFTSIIFSQPVTVEIEELATANLKMKQNKVKRPTILMLDDYEDGDALKFREWWVFDKVVIKTVNNENNEKLFNCK